MIDDGKLVICCEYVEVVAVGLFSMVLIVFIGSFRPAGAQRAEARTPSPAVWLKPKGRNVGRSCQHGGSEFSVRIRRPIYPGGELSSLVLTTTSRLAASGQ